VTSLAKRNKQKNKEYSKKASSRAGGKRSISQKRLVVFLISFFLIYFILGEIINLLDLSFLTNALASFSASVVGGVALGNLVILGEGSKFVVSNMCTGLVSASILAAVVFSLRKPNMKKKVALFVLGTILLMLINIPRIILVLLAAKAGFDAEMVHMATWFLMSAAILLIWYVGTKAWAKVEDFGELI